MSDNFPPSDKMCHHTGFASKCSELVFARKCSRWRDLPIEDPTTGKQLPSMWGCTDDLVLYLIGHSAMNARESFKASLDLRNTIHEAAARAQAAKLDRQDDTQLIEGASCKSLS